MKPSFSSLFKTLSFCALMAVLPTPGGAAATSSPAETDLLKDTRNCAAIKERGLRLHCYDEFAVKHGFFNADEAETQRKIMEQIGLWRVIEHRDETGRDVISLKLVADEPMILSTGVRRVPELNVRCKEQRTEVFLDWKGPLIASGSYDQAIFITSRMGSKDTAGQNWDLSLDKAAAFAPNPTDYVRVLRNTERLSLELTPVNESRKFVLFTMNGFENALDLLVKRCYN